MGILPTHKAETVGSNGVMGPFAPPRPPGGVSERCNPPAPGLSKAPKPRGSWSRCTVRSALRHQCPSQTNEMRPISGLFLRHVGLYKVPKSLKTGSAAQAAPHTDADSFQRNRTFLFHFGPHCYTHWKEKTHVRAGHTLCFDGAVESRPRIKAVTVCRCARGDDHINPSSQNQSE